MVKTKKGFVINWSKDDKEIFCWFVRHEDIKEGESIPVDRGYLEAYLNKNKRQIDKLFTQRAKLKVLNRVKHSEELNKSKRRKK